LKRAAKEKQSRPSDIEKYTGIGIDLWDAKEQEVRNKEVISNSWSSRALTK